MAEYQNLFTSVQVTAPSYPGVPLGRDEYQREGKGLHLHLLGGRPLGAMVGLS